MQSILTKEVKNHELRIMNIFKKLFFWRQDKEFPNIVSAKVLEIQKHPNADRLRIVKLDAGDRVVEPVVCGATNFEVNDVVALALPGATITQNIHSQTHEPFVLGKAKIRGVESQGMICAAFELGLSDKTGEGIMLLKKHVTLGNQFSSEMILKY
jgi:phenylalanyl-tRNA synthetase beta chain